MSVKPFPFDGPSLKAKVLYWGRKTAGVVYLDMNAAAAPEKDRVVKKRRWRPSYTDVQQLLVRASALAAHVGLPYGESQALHENFYR